MLMSTEHIDISSVTFIDIRSITDKEVDPLRWTKVILS